MANEGTRKLHTFEETKEKFFIYISDEKSRKLVEEAYNFACVAHQGQMRKSGEPYIHHLIEVCYILAEIQTGPSTLIAGLLHDTVEDTSVTLEDIEAKFGTDVKNIVDSLTKIQRLKLSHRSEEDFVAEDHRKIFLGMAKDVRVILIKLADRLHNMRTLDSLSSERQKALGRETLEVFAPIAHRLGMNKIKSELEDLSLKYIEPEKYSEIVNLVESKIKNGQKSLEQMTKKIADDLYNKKIPFQTESRVKSIYSIYRKIYLKHKKFEQIYDILALRIITETELNCYEILGTIHSTYKPVLGRFKDYIAMPKPNMYQSLHTCILSGDGNTFEIQIRTKDMDDVAESGVAAHWRYKEGSNYNPRKEQLEIEEKLHWLRDLVTISQESNSNAKEYVDTLSHDIFQANVYVFTPAGKVIELPTGATPIDFIYKIHTGLAEKTVGALVNGSMVPLNTELKTGDICEIKTNEKATGPNEKWLEIATTSYAKGHIRKFIAKKNAEFTKEERIYKGKQSLIESFKQIDIGESDAERYVDDQKVFDKFGVEDLDELYLGIANKNPVPAAIIDFLNLKKNNDVLKLRNKRQNDNDKCPVYVANAGDIAISLGNCCTPIPGDEIIGYITKGKGITVHRKDCPNIINEKRRLIEVFWKDDIENSTYPVDLKIECYERANLLLDIMSVLSQRKISASALNAVLHQAQMTTTVAITIYVKNAQILQDIINNLLNVKSVYEVTRATH